MIAWLVIEDCSLGVEATSLVVDLGAGSFAAVMLTIRWKGSGASATDVTVWKTQCSIL